MGSRWKGSIEPGSMPRAAPVLRHAGHHLDPQPSLLAAGSPTSTAACAASPATRSSAWACSRSRGSTRRRWCSSRCTWTCAPTEVPVTLPQGPGGPGQPPQAGGLVLAVPGGLDQPPGDVHLRRRLLPVQAGHRPRSLLGLLLTVPLTFGPITIGPITFSLYWMLVGVALSRARPARASTSAASPRCSSTTPASVDERGGCGVFPLHRAIGRCARRWC